MQGVKSFGGKNKAKWVRKERLEIGQVVGNDQQMQDFENAEESEGDIETCLE